MSRQEVVYLNGNFTPKEETTLSILDRGFLFGDGVYELIPIYNKKIFYVDAHLERLKSSLQQINIAPSLLEDVDIIDIINRLIDQNNYDDYFIYIHISRGVDQRRNHIYSEGYKPTILIMGENYIPFNRDVIINGKKAILEDDYRWLKSNIKSTSLLANVLIKNKANENGAYEALLLRDGFLTEGSASNVFMVKDGIIKTPRLSHKLLPGITRKFLVDLISLHQLEYSECDISRHELLDADEIFCSSSTNPVVPITQVNDKIICESAGSISLDLYEHAQNYIKTSFK
tara:strand:- start:42 stop:902 length:861 start_codon:yes stop_codon:yes gene_type:complete